MAVVDARVLALASDTSLPLLERARICSFFSRNLDEFFMVRVAGLLDQIESGVTVTSPDGRSPHQTLHEIREQALELTARQAKLWKRDLSPALEEAGIVVGQVEDCTKDELEELTERFGREVFPLLTPLAVGPGQPFPYISGLSLSLGLFVGDPDTGEERFARVKVPELLPRFMAVGERGLFIALERVIRHFLGWLFPKMEILECCAFRVTRDADFELSDEADDLLIAVESQLRRRRFGDAVRVEVAGSASKRMLDRLKRGLSLGDEQVYLVQGPLDLESLASSLELDRPELKNEQWFPLTHPRLAGVSSADDLFGEILEDDVARPPPVRLLHDELRGVRQLGGNRSRDPRSEDDGLPHERRVALGAGPRRGSGGRQAGRLPGRAEGPFRRAPQHRWSRALEEAGVHVVHGFPSLKIHAKTTLIVRREGKELRRYAHIGTGNYHAATARSYEDFGLFTADPEITADVADLFNFLTGFSRPKRFGSCSWRRSTCATA